MEWQSSISSRSHTSHYIIVDDEERNFQIKMTNRSICLIHSEAKKDGYDLFISTDNCGGLEKVAHGKTPKELKQFVEDNY